MNPDVRQKAQDLADALAGSDEYKNFVEARESLEQHEAAKIMLRDFRQKQMALQQKVLAGQQPTEAEAQSLQDAYQLVAFNPYVRKVIEAEAAFGEMLAQVQRILSEAVGAEVPEDEEAVEELSGDDSDRDKGPGKGQSRLWVPGR